MLSSLRLIGDPECIVFEGAVDKKMFNGYMNEMLLETLHPGDIVIMDNLSAHKSFDKSMFAVKGVEIRYLPAYSPDLNPIEQMWSKIKTNLREARATESEELFHAIGDALETITASNAKGWFEGCGYFQ